MSDCKDCVIDNCRHTGKPGVACIAFTPKESTIMYRFITGVILGFLLGLTIRLIPLNLIGVILP